MKLVDSHNRVASYLRIGVTDRCNLRCRYCMPAEGIDYVSRDDLLSYEEIIRLAGVFRSLGVTKVRLTGGEPFVRRDIGQLIQSLTGIFPKVHITTNATLLQDYIHQIKDWQVAGLNISIDSLDANKFWMITRRDAYQQVMNNILACINADISIKLNIVVMKGVNDDEIYDFLEFGRKHKVQVRFIEAMPFNEDDGNKSVYMPIDEIAMKIAGRYSELMKVNATDISSSEYFQIGDYQFGIIPAYSRSLCGSCNRIRMTPKGEFLNCLYSNTGLDLRSITRSEATDDDIASAILDHVQQKKLSGFEEEALRGEKVFNSMTTIGG